MEQVFLTDASDTSVFDDPVRLESRESTVRSRSSDFQLGILTYQLYRMFFNYFPAIIIEISNDFSFEINSMGT